LQQSIAATAASMAAPDLSNLAGKWSLAPGTIAFWQVIDATISKVSPESVRVYIHYAKDDCAGVCYAKQKNADVTFKATGAPGAYSAYSNNFFLTVLGDGRVSLKNEKYDVILVKEGAPVLVAGAATPMQMAPP
jgi:hypothetical protein